MLFPIGPFPSLPRCCCWAFVWLVWQAIVGKDSKKSKNYFAHQWAKEKAVREFIPSGFSFFEISSANNQLWISIR
jgi:hypothetical protein